MALYCFFDFFSFTCIFLSAFDLYVFLLHVLSLSLGLSLFFSRLLLLSFCFSALYAARTYLVNWFCVCANVCVSVLVAFAFKIFLSSASCAVCFDCFVLWQRPKGVGDVAEMAQGGRA